MRYLALVLVLLLSQTNSHASDYQVKENALGGSYYVEEVPNRGVSVSEIMSQSNSRYSNPTVNQALYNQQIEYQTRAIEIQRANHVSSLEHQYQGMERYARQQRQQANYEQANAVGNVLAAVLGAVFQDE